MSTIPPSIETAMRSQRWRSFPYRLAVWWCLVPFSLGLVLFQGAQACENPVYQYAIQRWKATPYELLIFEVSGEKQDPVVKQLKDRLLTQSVEQHDDANFRVVTSAQITEALWKKLGEPTRPSMAIALPLKRPIEECVFWQGEFTEPNVQLLLDSPARQAIREELLDGVAVVWVLLNSGDPDKDKRARATIEESIEKFRVHYEETEKEEAPRLAIQAVDRDDPNEAVFVSILSHVESGLDAEADKPIAMPVYGRGRALYALVGAGINPENVAEACTFITGPCACDAKDDNPGVDLLISCRWDEELERRQTFDDSEETPVDQPLVGLSTLVAKKESSPLTARVDPQKEQGEVPAREALPSEVPSTQPQDLSQLDPKGNLRGILLATFGLIAMGIGFLTVWTIRSKQR